jgi:DNA modification methylase
MRRPILNNSNLGQAVYDPFLGSGTTLIAAESVDPRAFGMEIDPLYVDVTVRRWQAFKGGVAVLKSDGRSFEQIATQRLATNTLLSAVSNGVPILRLRLSQQQGRQCLCR